MTIPLRKSNRLWTPIANALDTYRRRQLAEQDAHHELLWRLIHLEESVVVTLGGLLASRLLSLPRPPEKVVELQAAVTGIRVRASDERDFVADRGCLSGSIKAWILFLERYIADPESSGDSFWRSIAGYLNGGDEVSEPKIVESWRRISTVPENVVASRTRIKRLNAINELRNKLAHVPLPTNVLGVLHRNLRDELLPLLSEEYRAETFCADNDFRTTQWFDALRGVLIANRTWVTGSDFGPCGELRGEVSEVEADNVGRGDSQRAGSGLTRHTRAWFEGDDGQPIDWNVTPFFRFDEELKIGLLFRSPEIQEFQEQGDPVNGEYYRFAAEVEPIRHVDIPLNEIDPWIPRSMVSDPGPGAAGERAELQLGSVAVDENRWRSDADNAFRARDYATAILHYEELKDAKSVRYNEVAKLKHGTALSREARSAGAVDPERMLEKAIEVLDAAGVHRESGYQAQAHYEKSKALWHLARRRMWDRTVLARARDEAEAAAKISSAARYGTWLDRVVQTLEAAKPDGCLGAGLDLQGSVETMTAGG